MTSAGDHVHCFCTLNTAGSLCCHFCGMLHSQLVIDRRAKYAQREGVR